MNLFGAKTLTEKAYALLKTITSSQDDAIYFWLTETEHTASIGAEILATLSSHLSASVDAIVIDKTRSDYTLGLYRLLQQQPGVYTMTVDTYYELQSAIALVSEKVQFVQKNQKLTPQKLKKQLVDLGYTTHEEDALHFIAKGESITINQKNERIRVLFAIDEVDSIQHLDTKEELSDYILLPSEIDHEEVPVQMLPLPTFIDVVSDIVDYKPTENAIIFRSFQNQEDLTAFDLHKTTSYKRDFTQLAQDIDLWTDLGYDILIATVDQEVIKTALQKEDADFSHISLVDQIIPLTGFIDRSEKFVLLAHSDIFGRKQIKERKRRDDAVFVTKLAENDYVVHEDHGVGRYQGLTQTEIEGHTRENLVIEYAKGDRLYVPVELAYKVDKYIGEAKPKLQRLSGTSWIKLSRKATQESQEFARDLLKLYAQRSLVTVPAWKVFADADKELHESFAFEETPDQEQAIQDVYGDLQLPTPMDRLVVGDVGFGKTEVAVRAAYQAVLNHKQVAVLCPTTLLAQQHYDTFSKRLKGKGVSIEMLSRFTGKVGKNKDSITVKQVVEGVKNGSIDIVIGTHRLLSKDVDFANMGLIIIDEEQRFGVRHKEKLKTLRSQAHILTLSATPIPRTLYFSLSGLRNISTIQTPPKGEAAY